MVCTQNKDHECVELRLVPDTLFFPTTNLFHTPTYAYSCEPSWPAMAILKSGFLSTYVEKMNVRMFLKNRLLGARLFFGAHMGIDWISGNNLLVENSSMNHQSSLGMKTGND